jgi:hypothetical protein
MTSWCWHKWSKWEMVKINRDPFPASFPKPLELDPTDAQKRTCLKCNKIIVRDL